MSDRTFTEQDEAAEQLGIKVALARQEIIAQSCALASAMFTSGLEGARGHETQDWDLIIQNGCEALDQSVRELAEVLKGAE